MKISPTLTSALAVAALVIPAAGAQAAQPPDMHASTAIAAAAAREKAQTKQDLRSPDARDAAIHPRGPGHAINAPGATVVDSQSVNPLPGAPTWPVDPKPITSAPASQPVTTADDGIDWTTVLIGIAGSLLAFGGIALLMNRRHTPPRLGASV